MKNETTQGQLISVFGPDGSGKSAIYQILKKRCKEKSVKLDHYHWRPGFFPYKNAALIEKGHESFSKPHENIPRSIFLSIILAIYIYADFIFGYVFILKPKLNKGINIYYERYFYDLLIDQIRYRLNIPLFFRQLLSLLVFIPDKIVLLEAPPEVIYNRKQELSVKEILDQSNRLKKIFNGKNNIVVLDVLANDAVSCSEKIFSLLNQNNA